MSITLKTLISNRRGREGERDRNGSGWRGETQSKYTSWGQWRGEKVSLHWKPQCDEKLSSEAQERGEHRQRKREDVRGGGESAFTAGHFHMSVWEMDGWNQTPVKVRWKAETALFLHQMHPRSASGAFAVQVVILKCLGLSGSLLFHALWWDSYGAASLSNGACSAPSSALWVQNSA